MSWVPQSVSNAGTWISTGAANLRDGIGTRLTNAWDGAATRLATASAYASATATHYDTPLRLGAYSAVALGSWYMSGDGSWLTYLAPTAVAAAGAFRNRHSIHQVTAEQLENARPHLNRAGRYVSDTAHNNSGRMSAIAYGTATAASWYFDGGWSSLFTTLALGSVGAIRNGRELVQITYGQPNSETQAFSRDLRLFQDDATVSETIQPIPYDVVVRVHDQLRNFLINPRPLTGNDRWINAENREVLQEFADQLRVGIEANRSRNPIYIPPEMRAQLGQVLQYVIECEHAQIGYFSGPSLSTAPFIAEHQEYLRQFTDATRTYTRVELQRTVAILGRLIADPTPLVGAVSIGGRLIRNGPWQDPIYQRQYQLLQTGIQQLLDGEPLVGGIFSLPSHVRTAFAGTIDLCNQIRVSQQSYFRQGLDYGVRGTPEPVQRVVSAALNAWDATDTPNEVQRPVPGLMCLHLLLGDTSREFTTEEYGNFIRLLNGEYPGLGTHIAAEFGGTTSDVSTPTFRGEFRDAVTRAINAYTPTLEQETRERYEASAGRLASVVRPGSAFSEMPPEWQVAAQHSIEHPPLTTTASFSTPVRDAAVAVGREVVDQLRGVQTPVVTTTDADTSGGGGILNAAMTVGGAILNEVVGGSTSADESPGVLAMLTSIITGTEGSIVDRIYAAFATLPDQFSSNTHHLLLRGIRLALNSAQLNTWIDGQDQHTAEERAGLRTEIRGMVTFLDRVQADPIATVRLLGETKLAELGVTNPATITTNAYAIRIAANYLRNLFSNNVILVNGVAIPGLNTTQPASDLMANQSGINRDLERLSLTESVPDTPEARAAQSRVLDQELSVQKEAFVKNATAFAAFQLVEWWTGSPNRQGAIDAAIRAELQNRPLLGSDPTYYSELDALRRARGYYQTPDVFKDIMGEIRHYSPENQLSEFKRRYRERIDERTDLNWIQRKIAKVFLGFSMWGFDLVLKNSVSEVTSFAYDRMHAVDGAVQINMTPIQGLKNFLMGIHRGHALWVDDTTNAGASPQNPLLDRDQYMDHILRQKEYNLLYTADELNATLGDVLVDNFFPDLSWSSGLNKIWSEGVWAWCKTTPIDASSSWAPMNLPLQGLKWILTSPLHVGLGILSLATRIVQGGAGVIFKWGAKKALRDTSLVSNVLESSRGSLYEDSPYNIAMNEIVLEQLKEVYKELRRTPEDAEDSTRVRVAEPSNAQLDEILGLIDNLFEVQRTVNCRTPAELGEHLRNNRGYFDQLAADLRRSFQSAYEPQVKEQIGRTLMVIYESFLQPNQVKKQLAAILEVSNSAMTADIPEEERRHAAARGARVEAEIKNVRDNILHTIIDQAITEQVTQLGQTEVRVARAMDKWVKDALVVGDTRVNDVNGTTEDVAPLIPQWTTSLNRYESATSPREKQEALDQIRTTLHEYNDTLQMKMIDVRTSVFNAQTQNLLQTRANDVTLKLRNLVDEFVPLYNYQRIAGVNQRNSNAIRLINDHFNDIQAAIGDIQARGTDNFESLSRILSKVELVKSLLDGLGDSPSTNQGVNDLVRELRGIINGLSGVGAQLRAAAHNSIVLNRITDTELSAYIAVKQSNLANQTAIFSRTSSEYNRLHRNLEQNIRALSHTQSEVLRQKLDAIHDAATPEQITALQGEMSTLILGLRRSQDTSTRQSLEASNSSIGAMRGRANHIMSQTNTTPETAREMTSHLAAARAAITDLNGHLTDGQRRPITFSNSGVITSESAIPAGVGAYIFNEMRQSTDRLLLMAKKGHLFEGAIRHAVILPAINQAGRSRL